MALKNEELNIIKRAWELLEHVDHKTYEELKALYTYQLLKKKQASQKSNEYNKKHPEKHRQLNKEWARKKREGGKNK